MNDVPEGPLKRGWTTGACAAAGARAAFTALLDGEFPDPVAILLPGGQSPSFPLARHKFDGWTAGAEAFILKAAKAWEPAPAKVWFLKSENQQSIRDHVG